MGPKLLAWRGNDKKLSKKQVNQVSKIVNKSKKYKMSFGGLTTANATMSVAGWFDVISLAGTQGLDNITEGVESFERQGDTIMLKHYKQTFSFAVTYPILVTPVATIYVPTACIRVITARLFGKYSGTALDYFSSANGNANWIVEKGTVLMDKRFYLSASMNCKTLSFSIPCKTKKVPYALVQYNDDDPVGVEKNDIRSFVFIFSTLGADQSVVMDYSENIGYYDKY